MVNMVEFSASDLKISGYPKAPKGGMQTGKIQLGVEIVHIPTGITVVCEKHRSQLENREEALKMLKDALDGDDHVDVDFEISKAHISAAGWKLDNFNHSNPFGSYFIYINDIDRNKNQMFTVSKSYFAEFSVPLDVTAAMLAYLVAESVEACSESNDHVDPTFLFKLIAYIKSTKCYGVWVKQGHQKLHFCINLYHTNKGVNKTMLRPFVAQSDELVIHASSMHAYAQEVMKIDQERMPQWFQN